MQTVRRTSVRYAAVWLGMASLLVPVLAAPVVRFAAPEPAKGTRASQQAAAGSDAKFLGATTCAGPACHGRPEPADRARSQQTEFTVWSTRDKHHEAFDVLANEKSQRMAQHLKMDEPPQKSDKCLNCHSMNVLEPARRGQDFKLADGVSCDGCHGPAEKWFGTHLNEPYAESIKKGMKDIRSPMVRAEMCLSCHLGDRAEGKVVDHEMYAAGHPRLEFELAAYSQKLPPHWRDKKPSDENLPRAQLWAVGQVVSLREAARSAAADAGNGRWPEYAQFECAACHHDLNDDWRQIRPRLGPPGRPVWQANPTVELVRSLAGSDSIATSLQRINSQFTATPFGHAAKIAEQATAVQNQLVQLAQATNEHAIPPDESRRIALALCDMAQVIAWHGRPAAQQLSFAITALTSQLEAADSMFAADLAELQTQLSGPDADRHYDPAAFVRSIAAVRARLGKP